MNSKILDDSNKSLFNSRLFLIISLLLRTFSFSLIFNCLERFELLAYLLNFINL